MAEDARSAAAVAADYGDDHVSIGGRPQPCPANEGPSSSSSSTVIRVAPATSSSSSSSARRCRVPVEPLRDLTAKGSSAFLRRQAGLHGLTNASRKLTKSVLAELAHHYRTEHGVGVYDRIPLEEGQTSSGGHRHHLHQHHHHHRSPEDDEDEDQVSSTTCDRHELALSLLPGVWAGEGPPLSTTRRERRPDDDDEEEVASSTTTTTTTSSLPGGDLHLRRMWCFSPCLARTRQELESLGTSRLRPEAANHQIPNSSRKTKARVVSELWHHYLSCHLADLGVHAALDLGYYRQESSSDQHPHNI